MRAQNDTGAKDLIFRPLQLPSIPQRRKGREEKVGPRETEMMGNGKREPKGKLPNERKQSGTNGIGVFEKGKEHRRPRHIFIDVNVIGGTMLHCRDQRQTRDILHELQFEPSFLGSCT